MTEAYQMQINGRWYARVNGETLKDKHGHPRSFKTEAAAKKAAEMVCVSTGEQKYGPNV